MKSQRRLETILALLLLCAGCFTAAAQEIPFNASTPSSGTEGRNNTDPPGRIARVQYFSGEVSIQPGGVNDWVAADLNRPLTTSDRVWTDADSKAELNVGGAYIRMNSESSLTLTNVSNNTVQLEFDQGTLELTVRYLGGGQIYEVDTPNLAFTVMKPGVYRFDVFPGEDQTWVAVRQGYGEATGGGNAVKVKAGHQVRFSNGNLLQHIAEALPAPDGFDDWAKVRDQRLDTSVSAQYVAPGVIGYQDLDEYGSWQTVAPYGPVWVPTSVPVGWAPYRFGRWVWIAPWGWTWVDNARWGFAPFHYGRWVSTGGYWGWAPGPYRYWTPCYAPALVSWVGGPGFGIGFGFGAGWGGVNFGWFPLGWGEPFYPWYRGWYGRGLSSTYIRNVNVTNTYINNVTNITNNYYHHQITNANYANRNINGAVTAAPQAAFARSEAIDRAGVAVPRSALMHTSATHGIYATPTRTALLGGKEVRTSAPATAGLSRTVVTHAMPPRVPQIQRSLNTPQAVGASASPSGSATVHPPRTEAFVGNGSGFPVPRPPMASAETGDVAGNRGAASPAGVARPYVPRPPASYTYRAVPPANSEAARTAPGNTVRGTYSAAPGYASASGYHATPGASFAGHAATPYVPHYGANPGTAMGAPHYAAPAGGPHGSGSSHAMHPGGGSHNR